MILARYVRRPRRASHHAFKSEMSCSTCGSPSFGLAGIWSKIIPHHGKFFNTFPSILPFFCASPIQRHNILKPRKFRVMRTKQFSLAKLMSSAYFGLSITHGVPWAQGLACESLVGLLLSATLQHMALTIVYIDGLNLYYCALKGTAHRWLDIAAMSKAVLPTSCHIQAIKYYTAHISGRVDPNAPARQHAYLRALGSLPTVTILRKFSSH
jgi:hypothetical protein